MATSKPKKAFPFYSGKPAAETTEPAVVIGADRAPLDAPSGYLPDAGLQDAINVSLLLGLPLLLTGEPGTGKTRAGPALAYAMGWRTAKFETKSTSESRDLFYTYDAVGHLRSKDQSASSFIVYQALGRAILDAFPHDKVKHLVDAGQHSGPVRTVVTIDEVDKAPRDFPNDILNEIEDLYFKLPELGGVSSPKKADMAPELRPVVILTSNSEKQLPEAFLRRCVFYHIPTPTRERLAEIARERIAALAPEGALLSDTISLFESLRRQNLAKPVSLAELLNFLQAALELDANLNAKLRDQSDILERCLPTLIKTRQDRDRQSDLLKAWRAEP